MVSLKEMLQQTGLPVAYHHFKEAPQLPYVVYLFTDSENFGADNLAYVKNNNYQIELYTALKDPVKEKVLEDLFDSNEIFYEKSEVYIEKEEIYQILYQISI